MTPYASDGKHIFVSRAIGTSLSSAFGRSHLRVPRESREGLPKRSAIIGTGSDIKFLWTSTAARRLDCDSEDIRRDATRKREGRLVGANGNGATPGTRQKLEKVVIRFAGDSGDGMQLTGDRFTTEAALFGNDLATQPNYPAEIRAPQGTLPGVSSFQIQIADYDILTAGDRPDVLVAMNPAALKANVSDLPRGGLIIANSDEFTKRNLAKVGYEANPLEDDELSDYVVQAVPMTTLTLGAVESIGATKKDGQRAKNMFALGLLSWMYGRELEHSEVFIREKFARKPDVADANVLALKAGWNYGETTEAFASIYEIAPAKLKCGTTGRSRATPHWPTGW